MPARPLTGHGRHVADLMEVRVSSRVREHLQHASHRLDQATGTVWIGRGGARLGQRLVHQLNIGARQCGDLASWEFEQQRQRCVDHGERVGGCGRTVALAAFVGDRLLQRRGRVRLVDGDADLKF